MVRLIAAASTVFVIALTLGVATSGPSAGAQPFDGRMIFRFDTFGSEQLWTDTLRLNQAIETLSPAAALAVGLKVDVDALPPAVVTALTLGQVDLNDPAVTLLLLQLNAVVGVIGTVDGSHLTRVGITCALCHSTVDNSLTAGVGHRLDGWPNLDLDVGKIAALSPVFRPSLKAEFRQWGPGMYDPRHHIFDGTSITLLHPKERSVPVVIPPAYGLVAIETFTGDGPISYWNSYVGVTQMGGQGNFSDPRIGVSVTQEPDLVTSKLPALLAYQLSLLAPPPPAGSFNPAAAARGQAIFNDPALGAGRCARCHIPPTYTDVLSGPDPLVPVLHAPEEVGQDPRYADRTATKQYRTTPLRALWQHPPYFHDGSAKDLDAVVKHYDHVFRLHLTKQQKADLVEFLKSL